MGAKIGSFSFPAWWRQPDSNQRLSACKADALNQLSYASMMTCPKNGTGPATIPPAGWVALDQLSHASMASRTRRKSSGVPDTDAHRSHVRMARRLCRVDLLRSRVGRLLVSVVGGGRLLGVAEGPRSCGSRAAPGPCGTGRRPLRSQSGTWPPVAPLATPPGAGFGPVPGTGTLVKRCEVLGWPRKIGKLCAAYGR